jgi:hypothetical protein
MKQSYFASYKGGALIINCSVIPILNLRLSEAIEMSNVYYLYKSMESDMNGFVKYLETEGIPTLVQTLHTGNITISSY